jgi:serine/threonine protein kinase
MYKQIENLLMIDKIGEGQFTEVFKGRLIDTNEHFAVKVYKRDSQAISMISQETGILSRLSSPHIIHLNRQIDTRDHIYLVYQLCT